jgi:hypothetical protein
MSDDFFDHRLRLLREICEARERLATCHFGTAHSLPSAEDQMKAAAIFNHLSQLQDELLMLEPTANVSRPEVYRQHLFARKKKRVEFEENFREIGEALTQVTKSSENQDRTGPAKRQLKFAPHSKMVLSLLVDLKLLSQGGKLRIEKKRLEEFCQQADKKKIGTPASDNWSTTWRRTLDRENGARIIRSYLSALVGRARSSGSLPKE